MPGPRRHRCSLDIKASPSPGPGRAASAPRSPRSPRSPRPGRGTARLHGSHGAESRSRPRPRSAPAAGGHGERAAPGTHPGGLRGQAPPEALHGLAAAGRAARLRGLPHRRAVGAERCPLHRGDGWQSLPGAPGRPLPHGAGAPQTPLPGARPVPPPRQQHPQQQGRPPPPPAGGESGAQRGRAGAAVPAGGQGRGGRHGVRRGGLGHHHPQRPPAGQALPGGAAGDQPRRLQPPHPPRPHHHREDDVHRLPQEGHLQGRLWWPPGLQRGGRGGGHGRVPRLRQLQETRHLHPHRPVRRLDRQRHGLRGRGGGHALSRPRGPGSTPQLAAASTARAPTLLPGDSPTAEHGGLPPTPPEHPPAPGGRLGRGTAEKPGDRGPWRWPPLAKCGAGPGEGGGSEPPTLVEGTGFAER